MVITVEALYPPVPCTQLGWWQCRKQTPADFFSLSGFPKLQFHKFPLSFDLYKLSWHVEKNLPADCSAAQFLTPGFSHLTAKWVYVSAAIPYSPPQSLCLSLWNRGKTNNGWRCCEVAALHDRVKRLKRGFVLWLIWRAGRPVVLPRCTFSRSLGAESHRKVGVKEQILSLDLSRLLSGPPSLSTSVLLFAPGSSAARCGWNHIYDNKCTFDCFEKVKQSWWCLQIASELGVIRYLAFNT